MTIVIENQYIPLFPVIVEAGEFCLAAGWWSVGMAVGAATAGLLLIMRRLATDGGAADDLGRLVSYVTSLRIVSHVLSYHMLRGLVPYDTSQPGWSAASQSWSAEL